MTSNYPRKIKRLFLNILLLFGSLIITIVLIELASRITNPFSKKYPSYRKFYQYDSLLGWSHTKNIVDRFIQEDFNIELSYNSQGNRGPEITESKNDSLLRILILGDSFSEGWGVEFNEYFGEIMRRDLGKYNINAEVLTLAHAGYCTDQEYLQYLQQGRAWRPDIVLLMYYLYDFYDNTIPANWHFEKPLFQIQDGKMQLTNVPCPNMRFRIRRQTSNADQVSRTEAKISSMTLQEILHKYSRVYKIVTRGIKNIGFIREKLEAWGWVKIPVSDHELRKQQVSYPARNLDSLFAYAWTLTDSIITNLNTAVSEDGASLWIINIPDVDAVYPEKPKRILNLEGGSYTPNRASEQLASVCRNHRFTFIDLLPAFQQAVAENSYDNPLYFKTDVHWTRAGHDMVGKYLSKCISTDYNFELQKNDHPRPFSLLP